MDDYQVAQKLLFGSFAHAAAEGITAVIRETVEKIGETEAITREELGRRLGRPKQTVSWRVKKALDLELLTEVVQGRSRLLRRNRALPEQETPLPDVQEVEGWFFGVPIPYRRPGPYGLQCFDNFVEDFRHGGPKGFTANEWATWVGQPVKIIRRRLNRLVRSGLLVYTRRTQRYAVRTV